MTSPSSAFIGLGSNLEDPVAQVITAIDALTRLPLSRALAISSLYRSQPMGPQDQAPFVNAVVMLETFWSPLALLDQLQALEQRHQRRRLRHWGPRTLDLDLLLFDDLRLDHPRLTLPHPGVLERSFVLAPLADVSPSLEINDRPIEQWRHQLDQSMHEQGLKLPEPIEPCNGHAITESSLRNN